jgi:hypothetical protein
VCVVVVVIEGKVVPVLQHHAIKMSGEVEIELHKVRVTAREESYFMVILIMNIIRIQN